MAAIRAALFYVGMSLATMIIATLGIMMLPLPFHTRYRVMRHWATSVLWWLRVTCGLKYEVEGREHIPPGPCVVLAKHQSAWETIALQAILPPQTWVLKRELLFIPFFGWGLLAMSPIAIDRKAGRKALQQVVAQGIDRLRRNIWVVVFPEGTRTAPGTRGTYNVGGAKLAEEAGVQVLPVAHNAGVFWPRHSALKRPGTVRVVIGPPIETAGKKATAISRETEAWIEATQERLPLEP